MAEGERGELRGVSDLELYQSTRRSILRVINDVGLQIQQAA